MLPPKSLLTPGPWTAKGNTIKDGYGKPIATVFCRNATAHAYWFAHLPEFIAGFDESQAIAEFQKDVDTLRDERSSTVAELETAEDEIAELKSTIRSMTRISAEHI